MDDLMEYTVPSQPGKQIPLRTELRDHLSTLDVVWSNMYEGENISLENAKEKEAEFYKGAPPQWLNFYWSEKNGSPLVKRDMYDEMWKKVDVSKQKSCSICYVNLRHQPGSGGSTLAMQILWDLRKKLRCAKVLASSTDTKTIACQVVQLFIADGPKNQNTVLLLLDNVSDDPTFEKNLEHNLIGEIKASNVNAAVPVVIILNCVRQLTVTRSATLIRRLSETEKNKLKDKKAEIIQRHGDRHSKFHAFNIMLGDYSPLNVSKICTILHPIKTKKRPRELQACLALINSYAPGSYLSYDLCRQFFEDNDNALVEFSLENQMQPFTEILAIFSTREGLDGGEVKHVRMVHPMIAEECLQLLTSAGVTRSDITKSLLTDLCKQPVPPYMIKTIKKILTKRETKQDRDPFEGEDKNKFPRNDKATFQRPVKERSETQAKFSRLIQDIKEKENPQMCVSVLKMASQKLDKDPFLPQALARFYYIEMFDYKSAENWAKTAIKRDKENSFIRDTLGQVYKNHLKNLLRNGERSSIEILQLGKKVIEAFKDEAEAAEREQAPEMNEHGVTKVSNFFNNRGLYGFMEAANIIFDHLTKQNWEWSKVLTMEIPPERFFRSFPGENCGKYIDLLTSLRGEVENKFEFFEQYFIYSMPKTHKNEPDNFQANVESWYDSYVTQTGQTKSALQMLKERKVSTFAGLLRALDPSFSLTDLELIAAQLTDHLRSPRDADAAQKYILANIILSQRDAASKVLRPLGELQAILKRCWEEQKDNRSPEFYLLVLLLFWPSEDQVRNSPDISECVTLMQQSFERTYQKYLRSRYLVPLFYLGGGQGLQKLVHTSKLEKTHPDRIKKGDESDETLELLRVEGQMRSYKVFFVNGLKEIEVSPEQPAYVRREGKVSFHLGFNIKGPVAYNLQYEQ